MIFCGESRHTLLFASRAGGMPIIGAGGFLHMQECDAQPYLRPEDALAERANLDDIFGAEASAVLSMTQSTLLTNCDVRPPRHPGSSRRGPRAALCMHICCDTCVQ